MPCMQLCKKTYDQRTTIKKGKNMTCPTCGGAVYTRYEQGPDKWYTAMRCYSCGRDPDCVPATAQEKEKLLTKRPRVPPALLAIRINNLKKIVTFLGSFSAVGRKFPKISKASLADHVRGRYQICDDVARKYEKMLSLPPFYLDKDHAKQSEWKRILSDE